MQTEISEKALKRQICKTLNEDGFSELAFGLMLGIMAIFFFDHSHGWALPISVGIIAAFLELLRKKFTYPRVGYARFAELKGPGKYLIMAVIVIPLAAILMVLLSIDRLGWLLPPYAGAVLAGSALYRAVSYGAGVDYFFAVLYLAGGSIGFALVLAGIDPGKAVAYQFWGVSAALVPVGMIKLVRFVQKYPRLSEEVYDA